FRRPAGYKKLTIHCVRKWPDEKSCLLSYSLPSGLAPVWRVLLIGEDAHSHSYYYTTGSPLAQVLRTPRTPPCGQSSWPNCLSSLKISSAVPIRPASKKTMNQSGHVPYLLSRYHPR